MEKEFDTSTYEDKRSLEYSKSVRYNEGLIGFEWLRKNL